MPVEFSSTLPCLPQTSFGHTVHNVVRTARKLEVPLHAPHAPPTLAEQQLFGLPEDDDDDDEEEKGGGVRDDLSDDAPHPPTPFLCALCSGLLPLHPINAAAGVDAPRGAGLADAVAADYDGDGVAAASTAPLSAAAALPVAGSVLSLQVSPLSVPLTDSQVIPRGGSRSASHAPASAALCYGCRVSLLETRPPRSDATAASSTPTRRRRRGSRHSGLPEAPRVRAADARSQSAYALGSTVAQAVAPYWPDDVPLAPSAVAHVLPSFSLRSMLELSRDPPDISAPSTVAPGGIGAGAGNAVCRRLTREDMRRQIAGFLLASGSDSDSEPGQLRLGLP